MAAEASEVAIVDSVGVVGSADRDLITKAKAKIPTGLKEMALLVVGEADVAEAEGVAEVPLIQFYKALGRGRGDMGQDGAPSE